MAHVPFHGADNGTVSISVSASSQAIQVRPTGATGTFSCRVCNTGTATVWIASGGSGITTSAPSGSTVGGIPVPANAIEIMTLSGTHAAAIAVGATGSIYFTPGEGI